MTVQARPPVAEIGGVRRPLVRMFRDFREDGRTSMDIYADNLAAALRSAGSFDVDEFIPSIGLRIPGMKPAIQMRFSRYIGYPWQAFRSDATINHIIDHAYANLLFSLDPARTVVTVHDMIPVLAWRGLVPHLSHPHRPGLLEYSLGFLKKAAMLITVSENTKRDIVTHCGCDPGRIRVVPLSLPPGLCSYTKGERRACRARLNLPQGVNLVLIMGQQEYKNHAACLQVLARLVADNSVPVKLVRLGRPTPEWKAQVEAASMRAHVIELSFFPRSAMTDLYNAVDCLLFPSWYEGFGWPPLEAMACGTPVVASTAASLPEVVGSAGLLSAPDDVVGLTAQVRQLLENADRRADLVERGLRRATEFSAERLGAQVAGVYEEILSGSAG